MCVCVCVGGGGVSSVPSRHIKTKASSAPVPGLLAVQ